MYKRQQEAKTLVWFADSTQAIAAIALTDEIKQTSAQDISQLQEMGVEVHMLTGDKDVYKRQVLTCTCTLPFGWTSK